MAWRTHFTLLHPTPPAYTLGLRSGGSFVVRLVSYPLIHKSRVVSLARVLLFQCLLLFDICFLRVDRLTRFLLSGIFWHFPTTRLWWECGAASRPRYSDFKWLTTEQPAIQHSCSLNQRHIDLIHYSSADIPQANHVAHPKIWLIAQENGAVWVNGWCDREFERG